MRFVVLDFETYFSDEFTLSKMTTESYIRDPRFVAHGAAIKWSPNHDARWYDERELRYVLENEDWSDVFLICHHMQFDGLILSHHYNVHPKMLGCTLSMARLLIGNHLSVSLEAVRRHFGIPSKTTPYNLFKGKHWHELTPAVQQMVGDGACDEVESIWRIFNLLGKDFPREEFSVVDLTCRMFTEPALRGDVDLMAQVWEQEATAKEQRLQALNIDVAELQSAERFAQLLRAEGVEPEMKTGKPNADGSEKLIYAFAKTDEFMRELLEHDSERVRTLAEARLGAKSTLLQTRAATLGWMASRGPMPVYLRYCGAHTTRFSGGDSANWQNFKRGSAIRRAIMAPEGHLLGVVDLSQIECRLLNHIAGQTDVIEKFRTGVDPYIGIASMAYGEEVYKPAKGDPRFDAMVTMRGTGKQLELSCGYQAGAATIVNTARLGIYGPPVYIDEATGLRWRDIYRSTHPQVVAYWAEAGRMIARIAGGKPKDWGVMKIRDGSIYGPGGTMLHFPDLHYYRDPEGYEEFWRFKTRNGWAKLYSGKLVENVIQWLARIVMSQAMVRIAGQGYRILNTTHDEVLLLIPRDGREQEHLDACMLEMRRTPAWLPCIPLDCEGSIGERYEK